MVWAWGVSRPRVTGLLHGHAGRRSVTVRGVDSELVSGADVNMCESRQVKR